MSFFGLQEDLGSLPLFPSQQTELRVVKIQAGKPALLSMPVPNRANENSAIMISYQVAYFSGLATVVVLSCLQILSTFSTEMLTTLNMGNSKTA